MKLKTIVQISNKDNGIILVNYSSILTGGHRGCFNTLKKLTRILGGLSLLWLVI